MELARRRQRFSRLAPMKMFPPPEILVASSPSLAILLFLLAHCWNLLAALLFIHRVPLGSGIRVCNQRDRLIARCLDIMILSDFLLFVPSGRTLRLRSRPPYVHA